MQVLKENQSLQRKVTKKTETLKDNKIELKVLRKVITALSALGTRRTSAASHRMRLSMFCELTQAKLHLQSASMHRLGIHALHRVTPGCAKHASILHYHQCFEGKK